VRNDDSTPSEYSITAIDLAIRASEELAYESGCVLSIRKEHLGRLSLVRIPCLDRSA
jgi:hypothetical protein